MDTVYSKKIKCCGCGACANVCSKNAIKMEFDTEGFVYPIINSNLCIECNRCREICDFKKIKQFDRSYLPDTYILQYPGRENSQSGGAFIGLSDYIIDRAGSLYGCIMDGENKVRHIRSTTVNGRERMRGSKYVQSFIANIFSKINSDLNSGMLVLFTGTPCQGAAVGNYFKNHKMQANLIVVDLVCHGVSSPIVLHKYLTYLQIKHNCKITNFISRDLSDVGWGGEHFESYMADGIRYTDKIWWDIFYDNVAMRECCSKCPYTTIKRSGDFTIGDAWQIEKRNSELYDKIGTSLVMLHTDKARKIMAEVRLKSINKRVHIDDYLQVSMFMPSNIKKILRKNFLEKVNLNFQDALDFYYKNSHFNKWDDFVIKIRVRLYKAYIRGFVREFEFYRRNKHKGVKRDD